MYTYMCTYFRISWMQLKGEVEKQAIYKVAGVKELGE